MTISPAIIWQRLKKPLVYFNYVYSNDREGLGQASPLSVQSSKQCDMGNTMLHCLDMRTKKLCPPGSSLIAFFTRGTEPSGLLSGGGNVCIFPQVTIIASAHFSQISLASLWVAIVGSHSRQPKAVRCKQKPMNKTVKNHSDGQYSFGCGVWNYPYSVRFFLGGGRHHTIKGKKWYHPNCSTYQITWDIPSS